VHILALKHHLQLQVLMGAGAALRLGADKHHLPNGQHAIILQAPAEALALPRLHCPGERPLHLAASPAVEGVTGQYWVQRRPRRSAASSYDEALQRQLWAQSVTLVNL
jgi:hypothetical protein